MRGGKAGGILVTAGRGRGFGEQVFQSPSNLLAALHAGAVQTCHLCGHGACQSFLQRICFLGLSVSAVEGAQVGCLKVVERGGAPPPLAAPVQTWTPWQHAHGTAAAAAVHQNSVTQVAVVGCTSAGSTWRTWRDFGTWHRSLHGPSGPLLTS